MVRKENWSNQKKTSQSRIQEHQQTQTTYENRSGNQTWDSLMEGITALTTATPLLVVLNRASDLLAANWQYQTNMKNTIIVIFQVQRYSVSQWWESQ